MQTIDLSSGNLRVKLSPDVGGSIARFDLHTAAGPVPLFRPAPSGSRSVLEMASFPVVPFANRVRGGAFTLRGRTIALKPNMPGERFPLHGQGWLAAWRVVRSNGNSAELAYEHTPGEWPWGYEAAQIFVLEETTLEVTLTCRNTSLEAMPCGLAHHPFYLCSERTILDAGVEAVWTIDADVLPVKRVQPEGRYALQHRRICAAGLDNGYEGWSGRAEIDWPERQLHLTMISPAPRLQIYSPAAGAIFVAEPVTNANAALNAPEQQWAQLGLHILEPNCEIALTVRYDVRFPA